MGSNKAEVAVSYDVSNEFFRLWLDERMNYTCGLFEGTDNLEQAQLNKLAWLHDAAHVTKDSSVLDIGCGWGANIEYLAVNRNVRDVHGITLSTAQHEEIKRRKIPNVTSQVTSQVVGGAEVARRASERRLDARMAAAANPGGRT